MDRLNKARYNDILNQIEKEAISAYLSRKEPGISQNEQNLRALEERRLFSKGEVAKNPLMSIPLLLGAPIDAGLKKLGVRGGRSTSGFWPEVGAAYKGVGEGLSTALRRSE